MWRLPLASLAATLTTTLGVASGEPERRDPTRGYRLDVPPGWTAVERDAPGAHVLRLASPDEDAWVEVHAIPRAATATALDLERALLDFEKGFLRRAADIERVARRPATLGGIDGLAAVYRANDDEPWSLGAFVGAAGAWSYAIAWASADPAGPAVAEEARRAAESFSTAESAFSERTKDGAESAREKALSR
jgi:hypothetical protein